MSAPTGLEKLLIDRDADIVVGILRLSMGDVPAFVIDYGEAAEPISDLLRIHRRMDLSRHTLAPGAVKYIVTGDRGLGIVDKTKLAAIRSADIRTSHDLGKLCTEVRPLFSATIDVDPEWDERFREALGEQSFWLLLVRTSTDAFLAVDLKGTIIQVHEQQREELAHFPSMTD